MLNETADERQVKKKTGGAELGRGGRKGQRPGKGCVRQMWSYGVSRHVTLDHFVGLREHTGLCILSRPSNIKII